MIVIPARSLIILAALTALLWAGGSSLLHIVQSLLAIDAVRHALYGFVAGLTAGIPLALRVIAGRRYNRAVGKARDERRMDGVW